MSSADLGSSPPQDATTEVIWREFDKIEKNQSFAELLTQLMDLLQVERRQLALEDTYTTHPLLDKLTQLKKSKAEHLLRAIDHLRFYNSADGPKKKLPNFRLKPSVHYIRLKKCVVNKQYTVQIVLRNKSTFPAQWSVLTPHQDHQSIFFCAHPTSGYLPAGQRAMVSLELVILDARDFHRLVVFETIFDDKYRSLSPIFISTDVAKYPTEEECGVDPNAGDDLCYWNIPAGKLKPIAAAPHETTPPQHSASANGNLNVTKASTAPTATMTASATTPAILTSSTSSSNDSQASAKTAAAQAATAKRAEAKQQADERALALGAKCTLYGVPVRVRNVPLTTEGDEMDFWSAVSMASMRHPHLVNLLGVSTYGQEGHLVTRVFDNGRLRAFIENKDLYKPHKTFARKIEMLTSIAKAIQFVHDNDRLHRAIAAEHIFITDDFDVKLGIPRLFVRNSISNINRRDFGYDAPEVVANGSWSEAADTFSFGLVIWELLAEEIYEGTPEKVHDWMLKPPNDELLSRMKRQAEALGVPAALAQTLMSLILSCVAVDPAERPPSQKVLDTLQMIHDELEKHASLTPPMKRRRTREHNLDPRARQSEDFARAPSVDGTVEKTKTRRKKKKDPNITPAPPAPENIVFKDSDPESSPKASRANSTHDIETEPHRISVDIMLENTEKKKVKKKFKQSKHTNDASTAPEKVKPET